jgi:hypothetical protein
MQALRALSGRQATFDPGGRGRQESPAQSDPSAEPRSAAEVDRDLAWHGGRGLRDSLATRGRSTCKRGPGVGESGEGTLRLNRVGYHCRHGSGDESRHVFENPVWEWAFGATENERGIGWDPSGQKKFAASSLRVVQAFAPATAPTSRSRNGGGLAGSAW